MLTLASMSLPHGVTLARPAKRWLGYTEGCLNTRTHSTFHGQSLPKYFRKYSGDSSSLAVSCPAFLSSLSLYGNSD